MENINWKFADKFRSHWIKIKFYREKPIMKEAKSLKGVRFCEATKEAIIHPVLLDKTSINCQGAQYAFGWRSNYKTELLQSCYGKRQAQRDVLELMLTQIPYFKKPFEYIGLNTEGVPDLIMSYMPPGEVMNLVKMYHNHKGANLDISLCTMMSICGGIAVRTYLEEKISFSFGCDDSRKFADMRRENLAVGIPRKLFNIFVN